MAESLPISNTAIRVENLSKQYRLGVLSGARLRDDLSRWSASRIGSLLEVQTPAGRGFHQELTGRENVYLNGTILGMRKPEIDRKFDEACPRTGSWTFPGWRTSSTRRSNATAVAWSCAWPLPWPRTRSRRRCGSRNAR